MEHKTAKQANLYALGGFDHDALSVIDSQRNCFKQTGETMENKQKKTTSLASGSRSFTLVTTDHTSLDIFNTRVSEAPENKALSK